MLFVFFLGISFTFCSYADVIWEPANNRFYDSHISDMVLCQRTFYAESAVKTYKEPYTKASGTLEKGEEIYITYTYKDEYGMFEKDEKTLWVKMSDVKVVYDNEEFLDEHSKDFITYDKQENIECKDAQTYDYPNAEKSSGKITISKEDEIKPDYCYVDESGDTWGYFDYYYMGRHKFWLNLSELSGTSSSLSEKPDQTEKSDEKVTEKDTEKVTEKDSMKETVTVTSEVTSEEIKMQETKVEQNDSSQPQSDILKNDITEEKETSEADASEKSQPKKESADNKTVLVICFAVLAVVTGFTIPFVIKKKK